MRAFGSELAAGPETARIRAFLDAASEGAMEVPTGIGPGDDAAALVPPEGEQVVVSVDASVEGVHFRREWMTWETIGYRAATAALSDLAAMAASPIGLLVSAALPPEIGEDTAAALGRGVGEALSRTGGALLGGDLVASPGPVFLDVTVLGRARRPVPRSGASVGDEIWVTGELGGAAAAVHDLGRRMEPLPSARARLERPEARIGEARWLAAHADVRAMIDLSDGLPRDAGHLAAASGVAIVIDAERVPTPSDLAAVRAVGMGARLLLTGGEDYELLLALPAGTAGDLSGRFEAQHGIPLTRIGSVEDGSGVRFEGWDEAPLVGFDHFGGGSE